MKNECSRSKIVKNFKQNTRSKDSFNKEMYLDDGISREMRYMVDFSFLSTLNFGETKGFENVFKKYQELIKNKIKMYITDINYQQIEKAVYNGIFSLEKFEEVKRNCIVWRNVFSRPEIKELLSDSCSDYKKFTEKDFITVWDAIAMEESDKCSVTILTTRKEVVNLAKMNLISTVEEL